MASTETSTRIEELLGDEADALLQHVSRDDRRVAAAPARPGLRRPRRRLDRPLQPRSCATCSGCSTRGRLAGTGYVSILPVDQGIEHSAAASFAPNPMYFDPENLVRLAVEGGCNAVASTFGVLGAVSRQLGAPDPLHRQAQPQRAADVPERTTTRSCSGRSSGRGSWARRASARRSTSARRRATARSSRSPQAFEEAHRLGMFTVLWCYLRNSSFKIDGTTTTLAADLTGQANHLGVTIEADIIKQKLPENNGGYGALDALNGGLRQDEQARLRAAHDRQPDRPDPLPGRQLLHGPRRRSSTAAARRRARATWPRPCAPRSSTSAPAAPA